MQSDKSVTLFWHVNAVLFVVLNIGLYLFR